MKGFKYFQFQSDHTPRNPKEVIRRLNLLQLIRPILQNAPSVRHKRHSTPVRKATGVVVKETDYWIIESVSPETDNAIRIILRKPTGGEHVQFLSAYKVKQKIPPLG